MTQISRRNPEQVPEAANDNASTTSLRLRPPLIFTPAPSIWRMILYIGTESEQAVGVDIDGQVMIGRADPVDDYTPELDLTAYGARDAGVSRRHAVLFVADDRVYLRDLGSTNGTRVNTRPLAPDHPCIVAAGDRIEFGNLQVVIQHIEPLT
ncbi:MAG: FHA domain-containing protein [Anaerolineae bacterium]|nr:FHA domain-containing protein [Anaerolineae bacterium]